MLINRPLAKTGDAGGKIEGLCSNIIQMESCCGGGAAANLGVVH